MSHIVIFSDHVLCEHCFCALQVPISSVAIGVTHCEVAPNNILYAVNASIVGLCCLSEKVVGRGGPVVLSQTPVCQCVGLGVYSRSLVCGSEMELLSNCKAYVVALQIFIIHHADLEV